MADNYLERKMEEYRAGKLPGSKNRHIHACTKPQMLTLDLPKLRIFVTSADEPLVQAFTNAGCMVAFCGQNTNEGSRMAERTGARFYPFTPEEALTHFGEPDVVATRNLPTQVSLRLKNGRRLRIEADAEVETLCVIAASPRLSKLHEARLTPDRLTDRQTDGSGIIP